MARDWDNSEHHKNAVNSNTSFWPLPFKNLNKQEKKTRKEKKKTQKFLKNFFQKFIFQKSGRGKMWSINRKELDYLLIGYMIGLTGFHTRKKHFIVWFTLDSFNTFLKLSFIVQLFQFFFDCCILFSKIRFWIVLNVCVWILHELL